MTKQQEFILLGYVPPASVAVVGGVHCANLAMATDPLANCMLGYLPREQNDRPRITKKQSIMTAGN